MHTFELYQQNPRKAGEILRLHSLQATYRAKSVLVPASFDHTDQEGAILLKTPAWSTSVNPHLTANMPTNELPEALHAYFLEQEPHYSPPHKLKYEVCPAAEARFRLILNGKGALTVHVIGAVWANCDRCHQQGTDSNS